MTSQPGKQTITIHVLPYISKSKGYWTMKFGHIVEYNIRNVGETIPRPFSKKSK